MLQHKTKKAAHETECLKEFKPKHMEIKMKKAHDNSKALFDITCCISDTTTKLAAKVLFRVW